MAHIALFLTPELMVLGTKRFVPTDSFVNFRKGTFNIRLDAYLYKTQNDIIYGYIYPTDEKLLIDVTKNSEGIPARKDFIPQEPIKKTDKQTLESARLITLKEKIEHGDLHLLVAESIIGQLARAFLQTVKTNWLFVILAVGAGIGIGYIACSAINPSHTITLLQNASGTFKVSG
jgi:hypothetical protein